MLNRNFRWKHHISYIASRISRNIGIIARLRHLIPYPTLHNIYRSLIFPYLSYGLTAWGQAANSHLQTILVLQKRAVRLMHFAQFQDHAVPFFLSSNIMPLPMLYFQRVSSLMHDINNNVVPPNISNLFTLTQDFHHYNTRSSTSGNFYMNYSRLNHHKNSFSIIGAKIWNSIPKELR